MTLSDLSIRRPVFAVMVIMALIIFGALGYSGLGVSQFPDVEFPVVTVATLLRGAAPEVVETDVTEVVEKAVSSVQGIRTLTSQSVQGASIVTVEFELDRPIDQAVQDVRDKVASVIRELPRDIEPPQITKVNPGDNPILWLSIYGTRPYSEIADYADNNLSDQIQKIPGVGDIFPGARRKREIRVWVSKEKLEAYQLAVDDVTSAIGNQHLESPAGRLESEQIEFNLRTMGEFSAAEDLNGLAVARRQGATIFLRDIALVEDGLEDKRTFARYNGMPAAGLGIRKQRGANTVAVARAVKAQLVKIEKQIPDGMHLSIAFDGSQFIEEAIEEIQFTLLFSILLTAVMTHVFLLSLRSTVIIALSMPVSIISAFGFMYFMGFTLNTLTLLGLSLSVGIVVDDAIIFLENIYRHQEEGQERREAAFSGAREITFAALASTLSIVAIFIPVAFMQGIIGRFFYEFGITVSVAILVSYVFALTLTPMLCSQFLSVGKAHDPVSRFLDRFLESWPPLYRRFLHFCFRWRWLVLLLSLVVFASSLYFLTLLGKEFVPAEDQSRLLVHIRTPVGSSVDYTDEILLRCEAVVDKIPEIRGYFAAVGIGQERMANRGIMFITLIARNERQRSQAEIQRHLRQELARIPGMFAFVQDLSAAGLSAQRGYPIDFSLQGPDLKQLSGYAEQFKERLKGTPGILDVDSNYEVGMPELRIHPDRQRAEDLGVDVASINRSIQSLFGGIEVAKFKDKGKRYDVRLRLLAQDRGSPLAIGEIKTRNHGGLLIPLREVARFEDRASLLMIHRTNRQRSITITGNLGEGLKQAEALTMVEEMAGEILPEGYSITFSGTAQTFRETFWSLLFALVLGIIVAYMILGAQFNHFLLPLTVMVALPFSLTGAFVVLWATGQTLNLYSMIGILLLMGLVKKNSILLVDFAHQLQEKGHGCREALLEACPKRLRPILMTSFSTIIGALPVVLHLGPGAESRKPMAVAVIGGMIASTLLTLIVVPIIHELLHEFLQKFLQFCQKAGRYHGFRRGAPAPLLLLSLLLCAGCVTRPSRERAPTEEILAQPAVRNELPRPRMTRPAEAGQPPETLTLEDCYRLAIRRSERLERAGEDALLAQLQGRKALALALPRLGVKGRVFRQEEAPAFGGAQFFPLQREEYFLELDVPIFSGFQEHFARRQAKALESSSKAALKNLREALLLDVTEAFYAALQAQKEIAVREASLKLQEERAREAEARLKAGVLRRAELLLILAEAARERSDLLRARQDLEVLRDSLGFFLGFRPEKELVQPANPTGATIESIDGLIGEAEQIRQDLQALEKEVDAARQAVRAVFGDYWPKIRLEGEYYGRREGTVADVDWEARLEGELPLFDGGLRKARLREAYSLLRQAELARDELRRRIEQGVRQAAAELQSSRALLDALEGQLQAAQESYQLVKAEFERGQATNLEVLTSQNLLLKSQIELERERLQERINNARLRRFLGRPFLEDQRPETREPEDL